MTMLILGAGLSGRHIGKLAKGGFSKVYGTTRSQENFERLRTFGIEPLVFDGHQLTEQMLTVLRSVTYLVQSISPDEHGDRFLRLVPGLRALMPDLHWIGYLSTIGVYGNHDGAWVDENVSPTPLSKRSKERVLAENQWIERAGAENIPVALLRLSGIYGPGRNAFLNLEDGTARRLVKKDQVFNRIRVEDIARATLFLMERRAAGPFNITDDMPCPSQDVVALAAQLMGVEIPPGIAFETAELSPMQRSFYAENKRVSNAKIRALGFDFLFPNYKLSLENLWRDGHWHE